eukprot:CAMPEP_0113934390 /NCGR_PEP_ID=MMETSP1339-20121228/1725_1 /TAXON_ID=94617 /ORGANISM="Fibrocapsa japonica" /LENGTH=133 /DNA_ID=CAMNT_0000936181 /DNA_START=166 /DNA_END=564 /DNA_ORIENTATION=+ /assembly_acc=CAM_ASM_000762
MSGIQCAIFNHASSHSLIATINIINLFDAGFALDVVLDDVGQGLEHVGLALVDQVVDYRVPPDATPSRFASFLAWGSVLELKQRMGAGPAMAALFTSSSVTGPTPRDTTSTTTFSPLRPRQASSTAASTPSAS